MNGRYLPFGNSRNPLAQALSLVVLAVVLIGAIIMGAFVLMGLLGFAAVALLGFSLRNWWLRRQGRGPNDGGGSGPKRTEDIRYIEAEYEVIDKDADAERRRSGERR